jgi:histidine triad (HIT) family protein
MMSCIFCRIVNGEIPSRKIYENKDVLAFLDVNPASRGHCLVITKKHYEKFNEIDKNVLSSLIDAVQVVSKKIESELLPEGYNVINNNGRAAGQTVGHVHFHIVPRKEGDRVLEPWEPMVADETDLDKLQSTLEVKDGN